MGPKIALVASSSCPGCKFSYLLTAKEILFLMAWISKEIPRPRPLLLCWWTHTLYPCCSLSPNILLPLFSHGWMCTSKSIYLWLSAGVFAKHALNINNLTLLLALLLLLTLFCVLPFLLLLFKRVFINLLDLAPTLAPAELDPVLTIGGCEVGKSFLTLKWLLIAFFAPADEIFTISSLQLHLIKNDKLTSYHDFQRFALRNQKRTKKLG